MFGVLVKGSQSEGPVGGWEVDLSGTTTRILDKRGCLTTTVHGGVRLIRQVYFVKVVGSRQGGCLGPILNCGFWLNYV